MQRQQLNIVKAKIPFMTCLLSGDKVRPVIPMLDEAEIAYCTTVRETAEVLSHMVNWSEKTKSNN